MKCVEVLKEDFKEALSHIDFDKSYDPYSKTFMKALFIGQLLMACEEIEDDVEEELDGAKKYMARYEDTGDTSFREMAKDELKHAVESVKPERQISFFDYAAGWE